MKLLSSILATLLLTSGSAMVVAQTTTEQSGSDTGSAFDVIDRNGDGQIDKDEAESAGISDSRFERMDSNGDGNLSEQEYQQSGTGTGDTGGETGSDNW